MFNITSHYPLAIALLFLAVSVAASVYSYRKSHLSKQKKYALIAVRSLAIFLLLTLLLEPVLLSFAKLNTDSIDVVLTDNSRSNLLPGTTGTSKSEQVKNILGNNSLSSENNRVYIFSNSLDAVQNRDYINNITFDGYETNISEALKTLKTTLPGQPISSVTIITDGIISTGGNPVYDAREFQTAFNIIGIGDTVQKKDIVVYNVLHNERAFTGSATTIKVDLRNYLAVNETVNLHLQREGITISSKTVNIKNENELSEVTFDITESTPGFIRYRVYAEGVSGEITAKNNYFDFIIEFLENKTNILFVSSGPGYDNALVESIFKRLKNFNTTFRTAKNNSEFYEGAIDYRAFGELSAVFLLGFPSQGFNYDAVKNIALKCKEFNVPVIFFAQKNTDYKLLDIFEDLIPFNVSRSSGEGITSINVIGSQENAISKNSGELNSMQVFKNQAGIIQKPGSEVLITDRSGGDPLLITRSLGKSKSSAFLGYGLWKWRLNSHSNNESAAEKFIIETVNLSLVKDKKTKLRVYPVKSIFDYKENASFNAEVYDDEYKLTRNAVVTAKIISKDRKFSQKITFTPEENIFKASLPGLNVNDYTIEAEAEINRNIYANDNNRFIVDTLNTEYKNTKSDFSSMKELAQNTGGSFISSADFSPDKLKKIENPEPLMAHSHRNNLWENKFVLFLIIGLLTIEWVVKKRNNLP